MRQLTSVPAVMPESLSIFQFSTVKLQLILMKCSLALPHCGLHHLELKVASILAHEHGDVFTMDQLELSW